MASYRVPDFAELVSTYRRAIAEHRGSTEAEFTRPDAADTALDPTAPDRFNTEWLHHAIAGVPSPDTLIAELIATPDQSGPINIRGNDVPSGD